MFNRIILAAVMLAISTAGNAAKDKPTKEECPTLDHQEIEDLLRKAPSCQRAGALFEICQFGASGARLRRSAAPIWRASIRPSPSSPFPPGANKILVMAASRSVS